MKSTILIGLILLMLLAIPLSADVTTTKLHSKNAPANATPKLNAMYNEGWSGESYCPCGIDYGMNIECDFSAGGTMYMGFDGAMITQNIMLALAWDSLLQKYTYGTHRIDSILLGIVIRSFNFNVCGGCTDTTIMRAQDPDYDSSHLHTSFYYIVPLKVANDRGAYLTFGEGHHRMTCPDTGVATYFYRSYPYYPWIKSHIVDQDSCLNRTFLDSVGIDRGDDRIAKIDFSRENFPLIKPWGVQYHDTIWLKLRGDIATDAMSHSYDLAVAQHFDSVRPVGCWKFDNEVYAKSPCDLIQEPFAKVYFSATGDITPPPAVTGCFAVRKWNDSIQLQWNMMSGAVAYKVRYNWGPDSLGPYFFWTGTAGDSTANNSTTIRGLTHNRLYTFAVFAVDTAGNYSDRGSASYYSGIAEDSGSACTTITSLPYNIPAGNACYELSGTLTSNTYGINVGSYDNVTINLADDSIKFGTNNGNKNYGIYTYSNGAQNLTINGGHIIHNVLDSSSADTTRCILFNGVQGALINGVDLVVKGHNGKCIAMAENSKNIEIKNCRAANYTHGFRSRCYADAATIDYYTESTLGAGDYSVKIDSNTLEDCPHYGIFIHCQSTKYPLCYIFDNVISVDTRNDFYEWPQDNACFSTGDPFGIGVAYLRHGSMIYHNTITSGEYYGGGAGMLLQGLRGIAGDSIYVYDNHIDVHAGPDQIDGNGSMGGWAVGVYIRALEDDLKLWYKYISFKNNFIRVTVDADTNTTAWGRWGDGLRILIYDTCTYNNFYGNHVEVWRADSLIDTGFVSTMALSVARADTSATIPPEYPGTPWTETEPGINRIEHNYFGAYKTPVALGSWRAGLGANYILLNDDTVYCKSNVADSMGVQFVKKGTYFAHHIGNIMRDLIWTGFAKDSPVILGNLTASYDCLGKDIRFQRTLNLLVKDNLNRICPGATVRVMNNYGDTVASGLSGLDGRFSAIINYRYFCYDAPGMPDTGICGAVDSTYNPFRIEAKIGDDSISNVRTLSMTVAADTLKFLNWPGLPKRKILIKTHSIWK